MNCCNNLILSGFSNNNFVVLGNRFEGSPRYVAMDNLKCWNELPVTLEDMSVGSETYTRHLKPHLFNCFSETKS